jgi:hypothetical protein
VKENIDARKPTRRKVLLPLEFTEFGLMHQAKKETPWL